MMLIMSGLPTPRHFSEKQNSVIPWDFLPNKKVNLLICDSWLQPDLRSKSESYSFSGNKFWSLDLVWCSCESSLCKKPWISDLKNDWQTWPHSHNPGLDLNYSMHSYKNELYSQVSVLFTFFVSYLSLQSWNKMANLHGNCVSVCMIATGSRTPGEFPLICSEKSLNCKFNKKN